jgi:hypothetical protein
MEVDSGTLTIKLLEENIMVWEKTKEKLKDLKKLGTEKSPKERVLELASL